MWYLYIAAGTGVVMERLRPKKYDDISLWAKIMIPAVAGLLWPAIIGWVIIDIIKEYWT